MKWFKKIGLFVCVVPFVACSEQKPAGTESYTVTVDFHEDELLASSFLKDYQLIPLETPSTEAVISHIDRLLFAEDRVFVLDGISNKVLAFDGNGKFVASTAKMIGKGHNEYIHVCDAALDRDAQKLYMHCDAPFQMMVFDFNLNLEAIIPMDYYVREMAMEGDWVYGLRPNSRADSGNELIAVRKDSLNQPPRIVYANTNAIRGRLIMGRSLNACEDGVYVALPFENNICKVRDGRVVCIYEMDFGDEGLREHPIDKNMSPNAFDNHYMDIHWGIVNMSGSDSLLLFNTNRPHQFILNQKTKECQAYNETFHDKAPFSNQYITPSQGLSQGVAYEIGAKSVGRTLKRVEEGEKVLDTAVVNKMRQIVPDGNPMIMVGFFE